MRRKKLLWRLYPTYLFITLLSLAAVSWYASDSLRLFYLEQTAADLEVRARLLAPQILARLNVADAAAIDLLCKDLCKNAGTRITVILPSGEVIADSEENPRAMDNHADRPEVIEALADSVGISTRYSHTLRQDMMYVALVLEIDGQAAGVVRCALPLTSLSRALQGAYGRIVAGGLLIVILVAVISLLVSRGISRPIVRMKQVVKLYARGDLQHRLDIPNSEELAGLAEAFNQMAFQLDQRIRTITNQRNEQEAILASMAEGVLAVNNNEQIISLNEAAARMLGLSMPDSAERSVQETVRNTAIQSFIARALSAGETLEEEIVFRDGGEKFLRLTGAVLRDARNSRIGAVIVFNDLTQIRQLEKVRKDFVANVSHELKTPITSIKGFVETLLDGADKDRQEIHDFLEVIARQADRLNSIIDDLLLISRLERDIEDRPITLEEKRLVEILSSALEACQHRAAPKEIVLRMDCPDGLKVVVNSHLLEQAVVNLIDNAVKYSEPGRSVDVEGRAAEREAVICVRDSGCGIPQEHQGRLFERFYRVDPARSRKLGGTGLGLAIVKHIAQVHGGRATVESSPGEGSVFCIRLPFTRREN